MALFDVCIFIPTLHSPLKIRGVGWFPKVKYSSTKQRLKF